MFIILVYLFRLPAKSVVQGNHGGRGQKEREREREREEGRKEKKEQTEFSVV